MEGIKTSGECEEQVVVLKSMVRVSLPKGKQRFEGSGVKKQLFRGDLFVPHREGPEQRLWSGMYMICVGNSKQGRVARWRGWGGRSGEFWLGWKWTRVVGTVEIVTIFL